MQYWSWTKCEWHWSWGGNTDKTADTNKIVPEGLVSKVNDIDSDKGFEDIDDDSCFVSNNDKNNTTVTMYRSRDETVRP